MASTYKTPSELGLLQVNSRSTMYLCHVLLLLANLAAIVLADPRPVPTGWTLHRRAAPDTNVLVRISLVQSNVDNLDAYLLDVADPQSPNYGRHWTPEQVLDTFRPRQESVEVVTSWLSNELALDSHSLGLSLDRDVINLNITAAEAERIFDTEYNVYRWNDDGGERIGCHEGHSFPPHVSEHVNFVWPTLMRGERRLAARDHTLPSSRKPRAVQGVATEVSVERPGGSTPRWADSDLFPSRSPQFTKAWSTAIRL